MKELKSYYKELSDYIDDSYNLIGKNETIEPVLIPYLSYILASHHNVHERIDQLYASYKIDKDKVRDKVNEVDVEELSDYLSNESKGRYHKLVEICVCENKQTKKQLIKLLKRACPKACIQNVSRLDIFNTFRIGTFDLDYVSIVFLSVCLYGVFYNRDIETDCADWKDFKSCLICGMPLPKYHIENDIFNSKQKLSFDSVIKMSPNIGDKVYEKHEEDMRMILKANSYYKENLGKQFVAPLDSPEHMLDLEKFADENYILPKDAIHLTSSALKAPAVEDRIKAREKYRKLEKDSAYVKVSRRTMDFVRQLLCETGLFEELSSETLSKEDMTQMNMASLRLMDIDKVLETYPEPEEIWQELAPCEVLAGSTILLLAKRLKKLEKKYEDALGSLDEMKTTENAVVDNISLEADGDKPDYEGIISALRTKNKDLIRQIKAEKEIERSLKDELEKINEKLEEVEAEAKESFDRFLETNKQDSDGDDALDRTSIEHMKKVIEDAGTIFVSGHPQWQAMMKKEFPTTRFVDPREYTVSASTLNSANFIVYHLQLGNHSMYYKCISCKRADAKLLFINSNNVERSIREVYAYIMANKKESGDADAE